MPATFIIRPGGEIAWVNADFDYTKRSEPTDVIAAVKEIAKGE